MKTPSFKLSSLAAAFILAAFSSRADAQQIVFKELMYNPAGTKPEYIQIKNISGNPRDIAKWKFTQGITYEFPDFNAGSTQAHILAPFENIIISSADPATTRAQYPWIPAQQRVFGPWTLGTLDNAGEKVTLEDKNGVVQVTMEYKDRGRWPKAADGTGHSLMLIHENGNCNDWHNWKASPLQRGLAASGATVTTPIDLTGAGASWKYLVTPWGTVNGQWNTTGFDDSGWSTGNALFATSSEAGRAEVNAIGGIQTTVPDVGASNNIYYFRKTFTHSGSNPAAATITIDQAVDDGVTYYLNGALLGSVRHTPGDMLSQQNAPGWGGEFVGVELNALVVAGGTGLITGQNLLCAELHQVGASNSDAVFAAKVTVSDPGSGAAATVRLSEVHFNASGNVDWVEIQNTSGSSQSVATLFLASKNDFSDKVALSGSVAGNGFQSFTIPNGGFDVNSNNEVEIYLIDGSNNVIGAAGLTHLAGYDSIQAVWPVIPASKPAWQLLKTSEEWYSASTATQNAANSPSISSSIVINEIMNDPMSDQSQGEYIELRNKSGSPVSLTGWKMRGGVDFDFPAGTTIAGGGYLVIASNKAYIQSVYGGSPLGDWSGNLSNGGEYLRLEDQLGNLADEVDYKSGGDWPDLGTNRGSSMELIHPDMDNNRASAWRASDESTKGQWTAYSASGTFGQFSNLSSQPNWNDDEEREFHFRLVKEGHVVLRNISLTNGGGNMLQNVGSKSGNGNSNSGWLCQGTHAESYFSGGEFHIVADGSGDTAVDRVEIDCTGVNPGNNCTISFEARWVSGAPVLLGDMIDHTVGGVFRVTVPTNLGTPGAVNSRNNGTLQPQVDSIIHSPAVPTDSQDVKVTARVVPSNSNVYVFHREANHDNNSGYSNTQMFDNGSGGDAVANDGVFTATITSHKSNERKVQFYVRAETGGQNAYLPNYWDGSRVSKPAMWMVDNRTTNTTTIPTNLRRQRFIMSTYDHNAIMSGKDNNNGQLANFGYKYPSLNGHYFNTTFIHNENEVYYLAEIHAGGSTWHRDNSGNLERMERGKLRLPDDRIFRNRGKTCWDTAHRAYWNGHIANRMVLYLAYLIGYPASNEEETMYMIFNNTRCEMRIEKELTDGDLVSRVFENGNDGELYKQSENYAFRDIYHVHRVSPGWEYKNTDSPFAYSSSFPLKTKELSYDYSPLTDLFKTIATPGVTQAQLDRVMDADITLQAVAARGYAADWDGAPMHGGKNGFLYRKPSDNRMTLLHWDSDSAFEGGDKLNQSTIVGTLTHWRAYVDKPWNRRRINYYLTELNTKYTHGSARTQAWLEAQKNSYPANGGNYIWDRADNGRTLADDGNYNRDSMPSFFNSWLSDRSPIVINEINNNPGGGASGAFSVGFTANGSGGSGTSATVNITGTAPSKAYTVAIDNHPEAVLTWTNQTTYTLSGVVMRNGNNNLVLRMLDRNGVEVSGGTVNWSYNKTDNAKPVMKLEAEPDNVMLGELLTLDSSASYDPEANAFTFNWSSTPVVTMGTPTVTPANSKRTALLSTPGIYSFTVQGTDAGGSASITREVAVANTQDFESFTNPTIDTTMWTVGGMENKDNDSTSLSRWYSLYDTPGFLVMQVLDGSAKGLSHGNNQPTLLRNLDPDANITLLTEVNLQSRKFGTFFAGLYLETTEAEGSVKYAFGIENGTHLVAKRITTGSITNLGSVVTTFIENETKLRIRRVGTQLRFERKLNGVWDAPTLFTHSMTGAQDLSKGGVFLATSSAENARVAFDYIMVVNPANILPPTGLRITELMYHPRDNDNHEYIEVKNTSGSQIDLIGTKINTGITLNITTNIILAAGETAVFVKNTAAFQAKYPGVRVLAQWSAGSLADGGEQIILENAVGSEIHNFEYKDGGPGGPLYPNTFWPTYPDGEGGALEVVNTEGDYSNPANWRSTEDRPGGGVDADGDGIPDAWEAKFGTSSSDPQSKPRATTSVNGSNQTQISWGGVNGQNYRVQYCDNLGDAWQTVTGASSVPGVNGTVNFTDPQLPRPTKRFYRIMAL